MMGVIGPKKGGERSAGYGFTEKQILHKPHESKDCEIA